MVQEVVKALELYIEARVSVRKMLVNALARCHQVHPKGTEWTCRAEPNSPNTTVVQAVRVIPRAVSSYDEGGGSDWVLSANEF